MVNNLVFNDIMASYYYAVYADILGAALLLDSCKGPRAPAWQRFYFYSFLSLIIKIAGDTRPRILDSITFITPIYHEYLKSDSAKTERIYWRIMTMHIRIVVLMDCVYFSTPTLTFFKKRNSSKFSPREEQKKRWYIFYTTQWQAKFSLVSYLTPIPSFIESYKLFKNERIFYLRIPQLSRSV